MKKMMENERNTGEGQWGSKTRVRINRRRKDEIGKDWRAQASGERAREEHPRTEGASVRAETNERARTKEKCEKEKS